MAAAQGVVVKDGPPMVEVKNIFFKAISTVNYYTEEADADAVENDVAFAHFNRALDCSNKYGCLFLSYDNNFYVIRVKDIQAISKDPNEDTVAFSQLKKLNINNVALPVAPNVIALSNGEDYLAVDTVREDSAWVVVFKLADVINQGGACVPLCEVRCSSSSNSRVRGINWNPGENMSNLVAINVEDGALYLAKIIGPNNVELNRFAEGGVRSLCWSPKGKQLVVGKMNGTINQLKLDLTVAKQVQPPDQNSMPISILWTQTTQFLIVFQNQNESRIDFMQLDLPKGASPIYSNSGDIFVSDIVPEKCTCFFLQFMPWNAVMAMTNSASDVIVLVKESQNNAGEFWVPGDVADNRRAAFQLDNYARGAATYFGSQDQVVFNEAEVYPPMPIVFLLSQRGSLSVFSIVNSDRDAQSLKVETTDLVPDSLFNITSPAKDLTISRPSMPFSFASTPQPPPQGLNLSMSSTAEPSAQLPKQSSPFVPQVPSFTSSLPQQQGLTKSQPLQQTAFSLPQSQNQPSFQPPAGLTKPPPQKPLMAPIAQTQQQVSNKPQQQKLGGFTQQLPTDPRQLGTSTLPSPKDMAGLQKAVEEKRREMNTQIHKGSDLKGLEEDEQCAFVISEVRKFEQRLADFVAKMDSTRINLSGVLNTSFSAIERSVLSTLNVVEDFSSDIESTTKAQKEEVEILKERILNHFSQLEYAKSLVERSRDPRYLEHMRSRPLDPASQQKFESVSKMHNYITNQIAECRAHFYEQTRKRDSGFDRISYSQLIYLTLSNHSKIIRRLNSELDSIKERLGLAKHFNVFDDTDYLAVCEASYVGTKKDPGGLNGSTSTVDEITLRDLTSGISKAKLNQYSSRGDKNPIKLSNRKLLFIKKCSPKANVTKVKIDEAPWARSTKSTHPKPLKQHPAVGTDSRQTEVVTQEISLPSSSSIPSKGMSSLGSEPICLTPDNSRHASFGSAAYPSMTNPSMLSFGNSFTALATGSVSSDKPADNPPKVQSSLGAASILKSSFSSQAQPQPPTQVTVNFSGSAPTIVSSSSSQSPSTQSPTLANLLSSPPASSAGPFSSNKSGTSLLSSNNPPGALFTSQSQPFSFTTQTSGASGGLFSAGSGAFSFGSQQQSVQKSTTTSASGTAVAQSSSAPAFSFASATGVKQAMPPSSSVSASSLASPFVSTVASTGSPKTQTTASSTPQSPFTFSVGASSATSAMGSTTLSTASPAQKDTPSSTSLISFTTPTPAAKVPSISPDPSAESDSTAKPQPPTAPTSAGSSLFSSASISFGSPSNLFGAPANVVVSKSASPATTSSSGIVSGTAQTTVASSVSAAETKPSESKSTTDSIAATTDSAEILSSLNITPTSGGASLFGKPAAFSTTAFGKSGISFGTPPTGGLFGSSPAVTTTTTTTAAAIPAATTTTSSTPSLQSLPTAVTTTSTGGLFSSVPATTTTSSSGGLFAAPPTSTAPAVTSASAPPSGLFASTGLFSSPAATASTAAATGGLTGFATALNLSTDSTNKTTTSGGGGLFSTTTFGTAASQPASTGNIFGGSGGAFGTQQQQPQPGSTGVFGAATSQAGFGVFGQAKATTASAGVFGGTPAAAATTTSSTSVFGGAPAFGSSSPFGSSFGGTTTAPAFGSTGGGSVFGSAATSTNQTTGFGALAQQQPASTTSAFGSPFGGGGGSVFGSPSQPKPGLFSSSSFGSAAPAAATSTGSIFGGGGGSIFGQSSASPASGTFSSGAAAGGVAQQGFGFGQTKPATGTGFGSPPAVGAASPVFGGAATFGSSSPFGSSFTASPTSTFGAGGGSVFGGTATAAPSTGFGALAQQGTAAPTFGSGGGFGAAAASPQPSFGSPAQQQQSKPVFGGQAFSSWR